MHHAEQPTGLLVLLARSRRSSPNNLFLHARRLIDVALCRGPVVLAPLAPAVVLRLLTGLALVACGCGGFRGRPFAATAGRRSQLRCATGEVADLLLQRRHAGVSHDGHAAACQKLGVNRGHVLLQDLGAFGDLRGEHLLHRLLRGEAEVVGPRGQDGYRRPGSHRGVRGLHEDLGAQAPAGEDDQEQLGGRLSLTHLGLLHQALELPAIDRADHDLQHLHRRDGLCIANVRNNAHGVIPAFLLRAVRCLACSAGARHLGEGIQRRAVAFGQAVRHHTARDLGFAAQGGVGVLHHG
mmetsp:Transcript_70653/g.184222  ORF Transcript_70653/g.184222 Transcript_70653/m.184222 type:complete len:296 (+) Transcript_70653:188-1075(+)